MLSQPMSN